jgi:hypothetical protein
MPPATRIPSLAQLSSLPYASLRAGRKLVERLEELARRAEQLSKEMDFRFLFDPRRQLFAIGYNAAEERRDNSYYDLLASEARLTSFLAIAQDQIPQQNWFRLGRALTTTTNGKALLSWTATMFEYLIRRPRAWTQAWPLG